MKSINEIENELGIGNNFVDLTDPRDIEEINLRRRLGTRKPAKDELYSVNPDFDGNYSDPYNRVGVERNLSLFLNPRRHY